MAGLRPLQSRAHLGDDLAVPLPQAGACVDSGQDESRILDA